MYTKFHTHMHTYTRSKKKINRIYTMKCANDHIIYEKLYYIPIKLWPVFYSFSALNETKNKKLDCEKRIQWQIQCLFEVGGNSVFCVFRAFHAISIGVIQFVCLCV